MPQLHPSPWFLTFLLTWTIFMMILMPKTMKHEPTNDILSESQLNNNNSWNWPWH
uniref:ATP synthase complex subunit 8 n=1 Tax=Ichthyophis bombayensis TaxID=406260 RepID=W5RHD9_ICHBO|nr:ATP synthase F0 subunit 8 [Ichthyophis bombayensis]AGZ19007.1 ATP synthase F0 subunit 8 [Ichthyophis bombayensis]